MLEAIGPETQKKDKTTVPPILRTLNSMDKKGRFGTDYFAGAIMWVVTEEEISKQTSERWNMALGRIVNVFKKNQRLIGELGMMRPPQSLLEKLTTVEERIKYLAGGLERTANIRGRIKNKSFTHTIDNLSIDFNYDLVHVGSGGIRVEAIVADQHTGGLFNLGHLDFDILSNDILRVNEVQAETIDTNILNFGELRQSSKEDVNVYAKKLVNRLKHLQRTVRERIKKDRTLTKYPNLPQQPGVEELLVAAVRKNLIAQGLLQEAADVEILDAAETTWGNEYGAKVAADKALGRAIIQADDEAKNKIGFSEEEFHRQPTPEDLGCVVFQKIKDPKLLVDLLLQRVPVELRPTSETLATLFTRSSLYDILDYLTKLTVDYQMQFYPYWSVFRDLTENRFAYGRRISGKEIEQLPFVKHWL